MNLLSFKMSRWRDWVRIVYSESGRVGVVKVIWSMAVALVRRKRIPKAEWRRRLRVCNQCLIYNHQKKQCLREIEDSKFLGCGCYTPFKAMVESRCWGRRNIGEDFGWGGSWEDRIDSDKSVF